MKFFNVLKFLVEPLDNKEGPNLYGALRCLFMYTGIYCLYIFGSFFANIQLNGMFENIFLSYIFIITMLTMFWPYIKKRYDK